MNGRIYDPLLGRFLSADHKVDGILNLQGYNRYSYVSNNPLTYFDPDGYRKKQPQVRVVYDPTTPMGKVDMFVREFGKQMDQTLVGTVNVVDNVKAGTDRMVTVGERALDSGDSFPQAASQMLGVGSMDVLPVIGPLARTITGQDPGRPDGQTELSGTERAQQAAVAVSQAAGTTAALTKLKSGSVSPNPVEPDVKAPAANSGANGVSGQNLKKQLASEQSTADVLSGNGERMAGAGTKTEFRDAAQKAAAYGGDAADYAKVKGTSTDISNTIGYGEKIETHAVQNTKTGEIFEQKTKLFND